MHAYPEDFPVFYMRKVRLLERILCLEISKQTQLLRREINRNFAPWSSTC